MLHLQQVCNAPWPQDGSGTECRLSEDYFSVGRGVYFYSGATTSCGEPLLLLWGVF